MRTRAPLLQTVALTAKYGDRLLVDKLDLCLDQGDKVALIGRNGVGKSTLLHLLGGDGRPQHGTVTVRGPLRLVPQVLPPGAGSPGQRRREQLERARTSGAQLLLLDEPTQDLDQPNVDWLGSWLARWEEALLVATHDRRLLADFHHFFVMAESGCRYFSGSFAALEEDLEREFRAQQARYLRRLSHQSKVEEHTLHSARRRQRKKQYGRVREIDRATSRACLNLKRSQAQVSHGRIDSLREERLGEVREWTHSARRSLKVELPLELEMPKLEDSTTPVVQARELSAFRDGRWLFKDVNIAAGRGRLAVKGSNGAGKTTLLQILTGARSPDTGTVQLDPARLGVIEQGGANWMLDESLVDVLSRALRPEAVGRRLVAQRFPLALAQRPLRTLSPGERVRAALLALLSQDPPVELLVLDEPTYSLDLLGQMALRELLRAWPGGLVMASHDAEFLQAVGVDRELSLD